MSRADTPAEIARTRSVRVEAVLGGTADLRGYPYRYLTLLALRGLGGGGRVTRLVECAEMLEQWGWQLVSVAEVDDTVQGILRRR